MLKYTKLLWDKKIDYTSFSVCPLKRWATLITINNEYSLCKYEFNKDEYEILFSTNNNNFGYICSFNEVFLDYLTIRKTKNILNFNNNNNNNANIYDFKQSYNIAKSFLEHKLDNKPEEIELLLLSSLVDSISNYTVFPLGFNHAKKYTSNNHFTVFVDKISNAYRDCSNINYTVSNINFTIEYETVSIWYEWLINNKDYLFLNPYYELNNGELKGIKYFDSQSVNNFNPTNEAEVNECIINMINRIIARADLIYENRKIQNQ